MAEVVDQDRHVARRPAELIDEWGQPDDRSGEHGPTAPHHEPAAIVTPRRAERPRPSRPRASRRRRAGSRHGPGCCTSRPPPPAEPPTGRARAGTTPTSTNTRNGRSPIHGFHGSVSMSGPPARTTNARHPARTAVNIGPPRRHASHRARTSVARWTVATLTIEREAARPERGVHRPHRDPQRRPRVRTLDTVDVLDPPGSAHQRRVRPEAAHVELGLCHVAGRVPGRPSQCDQRDDDRDEHDRRRYGDTDAGTDVGDRPVMHATKVVPTAGHPP